MVEGVGHGLNLAARPVAPERQEPCDLLDGEAEVAAGELKFVQALRLDATYSYVGEYAVNATNTLLAESYELLGVSASYSFDTATPFRVYLKG